MPDRLCDGGHVLPDHPEGPTVAFPVKADDWRGKGNVKWWNEMETEVVMTIYDVKSDFLAAGENVTIEMPSLAIL